MKRYSIITNNFETSKELKQCYTIVGAIVYTFKLLRTTNLNLEAWVDIMDNKTGEIMIVLSR
jgi:hypothetical protein